MHLATIRTANGPRAAVGTDAGFVDLHATDPQLPRDVRTLLAQGRDALAKAAEAARRTDAVVISPDSLKFLPPVPDPIKIICIGLNYRDHAAESGAPIPAEPIVFSKYPTALIGHEADIVLPQTSREVDYEAELVVVMGRCGRFIAKEDALDYVAGYTIGNDVSARDWQLKKAGGQWMIGKTFDTFAPTGPVLVTADEFDQPFDQAIQLRLNGETMQRSRTSQMIFGVDELVHYLSTVFTLDVGDLIFTGTPPGVGMARKPPRFLQPGDVVEVEIEGLGTLRNHVAAEKPAK